MKKNNYMTTGEFAKAMGVTKNTLFHYDNIGLFSPDMVLDNDYRYYSVYQMELFDTILLLKELGMSLVQIKDFLQNRSPEQLLSIFKKRENQIDTQIESLLLQRSWIQEQKAKISRLQSLDFSQVGIRHYPRRYFVSMKVSEKTDAEFFYRTNEIITEFLEKNSHTDYDIGYLQRGADIQNGNYDNCDNILLITAKEPLGMTYEILEEGDYLVAFHKGQWETIGECYERLLAYARENHIPLKDSFIEYLIIDNLMAANPEDYVAEISVRIG